MSVQIVIDLDNQPDDADDIGLTLRQQVLEDAYESTVEVLGKFDKSTGPDGAHYADQMNNPFAVSGIKCGNCVFYDGQGGCEIVDGFIQEEAVCKLWIIPPGLTKGAKPDFFKGVFLPE